MRKLLMVGAVLAALVFPTASTLSSPSAPARLRHRDGRRREGLRDVQTTSGRRSDQLDLMYRATPEIAIGAYFSYGFGQPSGLASDFCDLAGADCSTSNMRLGLQGFYSFTKVSPSVVPWLGLGFGWENNSFDAGGGSAGVSGWEYLNLQGGANRKVSRAFLGRPLRHVLARRVPRPSRATTSPRRPCTPG
ncbi:MAG: hypothetical protein MZU95_05290 [Desulfomicrobium escambiense]|nr:hypothetical protein [Desulfomicrobium escambiense]